MVEWFIAAWGSGSWDDKSDPKAVHEAHLLRLSIDKAHAELGFTPRWDAKAAIGATVAGTARTPPVPRAPSSARSR
ncbi:MAG: hypothetical protein U0235_14445 [Polyangiaceae bacterium]